MSTSGRYSHLDGREEDDDDGVDFGNDNDIDIDNNGAQFAALEDQQDDEFADEAAFVEHEEQRGANADNGDDRPSTSTTGTGNAEQIYTAALQDEPAAWIFLVADLPGAILASAVLYSFKSHQEHGPALQVMLCTCVGAGALILVATGLFAANVIGGLVWQMVLGVGLYVAYNILTSAVYDRIVAATNTEGTCTFLVFLGDCFGYVVTFAILLLRDFGSSSSSSASDDDEDEDEDDSILSVFLTFVYLGIGVSVGCLLAARCYFWKRLREDDNASELEVVRLAEQSELDLDGHVIT